MTEYLPFLVVGLAVGLLAAWLIYRRKGRVPEIGDRVFKITDKRTMAASGLGLWVEDGCTVTETEIDAIQIGLGRTFDKARCCGYSGALSLAEYIFAIVKGEPDSNGDPTFRVPAGEYAGTVYDKGGYILVAGQTIWIGVPRGNIIVVPEHNGKLGHLSLISEYESEHVVLAYNDGDEYERTRFHGYGAPHPVIPNCPGVARMVTERAEHILCGGAPALTPVQRMIAETGEVVVPKSFLDK